MSRTLNNLAARFKALPRAAKWLIIFLGVIAVYFGLVETSLDATNRLNAKSDLLAAGLVQERDLLVSDSAKGRAMADGQRIFGEPILPTDDANRAEGLHNIVDQILKKHGVTKPNKSERQIPLPADQAVALSGRADATGDRLVLDINFEASPETIMAIVAELEQAKEVAAVSRIEIRRADTGRDKGSGPAPVGRVLKATISPESWIINKPSTTVASTGGAR